MWIGDRADGWVPNRSRIKANQSMIAEFHIIEHGEFHEEVVRVLAIYDGLAEGGLALLKEFRIIAAGDGGGLKRKHGPQRKLAEDELALGHAHCPIGGK